MVDENGTVAVAVVGNAEVEILARDELAERFGVGGAAVHVDGLAEAGVGVDEFHGGTECLEDLFADNAGGTVRAVHADMEAREVGAL